MIEDEEVKVEQSEVEDENLNLNPDDALTPEKAKRKTRFFNESSFFSLLLIFGILMSTFLYIFQVWLTPIKVIGISMQPTINKSVVDDNDEDHCDIVYYAKHSSYQNSDIVIVKNENEKYVKDEIVIDKNGISQSQSIDYLIKRVIACPGQKIRFYLTETEPDTERRYFFNVVVLDAGGNDIGLDQSYLSEPMYFTHYQVIGYGDSSSKYYFPFFYNLFSKLENDGIVEYNVPENSYFVMGDNRNNSEDSRYFGFVAYEDIAGSVELTVAYGQNIFSAIWIKLKSLTKR